jgi:hypothetical protein
MVYSDQYITIVISEIAEIGNDGQANLFTTYKSGATSKTVYRTPEELAQVFGLIQAMVVKHNTGKTPEEHAVDGTMVSQNDDGGLSLVENPE